MTKKEFKKIFNKGFNKWILKGENSELKCFTCGELAEMKKINRRTKIICVNNHRYNLIDYLIRNTAVRDGLLVNQLDNFCCFNFKK